MVIYRIAQSEYKDDLSGYGAFLYGGRWNSKGIFALYCTEHISLGLLEILVNMDRSYSPIVKPYHLIEINIPDAQIQVLENRVLKTNWKDDQEYSQYIGDQFLQLKEVLALKIPSAVVPEEYNFLLNPGHPEFKKVKIAATRPYPLDKRLLQAK